MFLRNECACDHACGAMWQCSNSQAELEQNQSGAKEDTWQRDARASPQDERGVEAHAQQGRGGVEGNPQDERGVEAHAQNERGGIVVDSQDECGVEAHVQNKRGGVEANSQ